MAGHDQWSVSLACVTKKTTYQITPSGCVSRRANIARTHLRQRAPQAAVVSLRDSKRSNNQRAARCKHAVRGRAAAARRHRPSLLSAARRTCLPRRPPRPLTGRGGPAPHSLTEGRRRRGGGRRILRFKYSSERQVSALFKSAQGGGGWIGHIGIPTPSPLGSIIISIYTKKAS